MKNRETKNDRLFYDSQNKILFYIPSYYTNGTGMLKNLIPNLLEGERVLRQLVPTGDIYASEILKSRRYRSMWSFHISCESCPPEAFDIGKSWTFSSWTSD